MGRFSHLNPEEITALYEAVGFMVSSGSSRIYDISKGLMDELRQAMRITPVK